MYGCVWAPVHWQWCPLSLEVPCFPEHLLAPSHRGPSDLVHLSEGRRKRVNRYFVAAQREANATKLCTWHSSTAFLSVCVCETWQQDAGGDALQDSAHCLPWAKWARGTADNLLHQQLHRLEEETQSNGRRPHMSHVYCRTACPLNTSLGHMKLSPPTQSKRVWPSYECSACFS